MFSTLNTSLDNGLKVILRRIPNQRTISCGVWVNQGGKDEDEGNNGISHLVEHLMFKINCKNTKEGIEDRIKNILNIGAKYNASTTKDYTSFYIDGLNRDIEYILETLSFLVTNKDLVEEEKLIKEKQIVLREAEGYLSSTRQIAERLGQAMWGDMSFGQLVIGKPEAIKSITTMQIDDLIKNSYVPENCVLVVVGGFEYDDALQSIERYFSNWEDSCIQEREYVIQEKPGIYLNSSFSGERSTLSLGFSTYPITDGREKYIDVLKDILVSPGSILFNKLREELGLVYSIFGFTTSLSLYGNMGVAFSANNKYVNQIVEICIQEIKKLVDSGVRQCDVDRVKMIKETELLLMIESTSNQLQTIGKYACRGKLFSVEDELRQLKKIEVNKLNSIIKETISSESLSLAAIGNINIDKVIPLLEI